MWAVSSEERKAKISEVFQKRVPAYREDVVLFAHEVLHFDPDPWQVEVFRDIVREPRVAVKSGQGVGKTGCEAILVLWFLCCFPFPRVVATAPTKQQLHDVLWAECAKWQARSPLLTSILKWTKTYIYMKGYEKRWFAVARTATKPENMQGFHEDNMLFVVDEASGVADPIMEAITGTLSGVNNKLLLCGNPTRTSGTFHDAFTADRALYSCHTVNSEDSPRTNKTNIKAMERKYGRDSNYFRVRVLGEFPKAEDDVFIPIDRVEMSIMTDYTSFGRDEKGGLKPVAPIELIDIGVDVARFGDDRTCIAYRVNERVEVYKKYRGQDLMWTANTVLQLALHLREQYEFKDVIPIKIDDGGLGGGVTDKLREMIRNNPAEYGFIVVIPVNFGKVIKHKYYYDSTTYMMSVVRDMLGGVDDDGNDIPCQVVLPNDPDMVAQLSTRKYHFVGGKVAVESKDKYKERSGGQSPDEADCILLVLLPYNRQKR